MKILKKRHLIWVIPLAIILFINLAGCFQFRTSDRKLTKQLGAKKIIPHFHNYTDSNQVIHYWDVPNPGKPLIMFVHGSPGSSTALLNIATDSIVTANAQILLVDRPGFGYSGFGKGEKSLARQSEMLNGILKLYPQKRKILVGHSLGGPLIAKMAIDNPHGIESLVILAGSIDPELEPQEWHRKLIGNNLIRWMVPKSFRASNDEIITLKADLEKMIPDWKKIKIPVVVIQGTKDGFVPKENADFAKKMLTNAKVKVRMLPGESHFFPFTKPEIVVEELILLLNK